MPSEEKEKSRGLYWVVGAIILAPLLYVLSVGPAVWVARSNPALVPLVRAAYAPVTWLHDHTPLKRPLEEYVQRWGDE